MPNGFNTVLAEAGRIVAVLGKALTGKRKSICFLMKGDNMKKFISLLVAGIMLLVICSCSAGAEGENSKTESESGPAASESGTESEETKVSWSAFDFVSDDGSSVVYPYASFIATSNNFTSSDSVVFLAMYFIPENDAFMLDLIEYDQENESSKTVISNSSDQITVRYKPYGPLSETTELNTVDDAEDLLVAGTSIVLYRKNYANLHVGLYDNENIIPFSITVSSNDGSVKTMDFEIDGSGFAELRS